jgi:transposase
MGWDALSALTLTPDQKEQRRLAAGQDLLDGKRQADIAEDYGATAHRWAHTVETEGLDGLKSTRTNAGRPPKLDAENKQRLAELLQQGAQAHGWDTDLWTRKRVAQLIDRAFDVDYSPRHCSRILHEIGFRPVKPKRPANEKDEAEKQRWLAEEAEELKKT